MTTNTAPTRSGEILGKAFSSYLNSMQSSEQDISFTHVVSNDHRTLQQKATATMLTAILAMAANADGHGSVDARNEQSAALCQKIRDLCVAEDVFVDSAGAVRFAFI